MQAFKPAQVGASCAREDVIVSVTEAGELANHQLYGTRPRSIESTRTGEAREAVSRPDGVL